MHYYLILAKDPWGLFPKKVTYIVVVYNVMSLQRFGALPKRSATDLVSCLVHNVEVACSLGKVVWVLTFEIKGPFDTALPSRLRKILYDQGRLSR